MRTHRLTLSVALLLAIVGCCQVALAETSQGPPPVAPLPPESAPERQNPSPDWGEPITWEGLSTTYDIYKENFVYGADPFLITDMRTEEKYQDKESYEMRSFTVYRAYDGEELLDGQPVVFFVHGGAWTDGYENWYDFVSQSFTGEKGWVTVVIDYRLTSDQVFIADEYCPDRATCDLPPNIISRTKAAWYPDNIHDVSDAFRWVLDNISDNGGNADQIVLFGHSAGGQLVSLFATHPDYQVMFRHAIRGVISMSGAYSMKDLNMLTFGSALDQTFRGGHADNDAELDEASPATYVVEGITLPPFYLLHSQQELPSLYTQKIVFKDRLLSLGLPVYFDYLPGYDHYTEMEVIGDISELPTALIIDFIETILNLAKERLYLPMIIR
ncbi:MAG: alpha/beta hydrolase [Anaerolineae bacterium]|nr:alpha/beta hydrolase [Anaerolineae bacterium]